MTYWVYNVAIDVLISSDHANEQLLPRYVDWRGRGVSKVSASKVTGLRGIARKAEFWVELASDAQK